MAINQTIFIKQSVGNSGFNQRENVRGIQIQLNAQMPLGMKKLVVDSK